MRIVTGIRPAWARLGLLLIVGSVFAGACSASNQPGPTTADSDAAAAPAQSAQPAASPAVQRQLKVEPVSGPAGTKFSVSGDGFPAGATVEFSWSTWDGTFKTGIQPETIAFYEPVFTQKQVPLGSATADQKGGVSATFVAMEDYGGIHDIFALVDRERVARGGFEVKRTVSITPSEGPVGTPITVRVTGLGTNAIERVLAVRYGNQYVGYISAITTRGTAEATIRAAGPVGLYNIELSGAGNHGGGYLNNQQSPYARVFPATGSFRFAFRVTDDRGAPPNSVERPAGDRVQQLAADAPRTTFTKTSPAPGVAASFSPTAGPIRSATTLRATGLQPDATISLIWVTARGNRVTPSGWEFNEVDLGSAKADRGGALEAPLEVPDGLGGWHVVRLVQDRQVVAEVPFFVEQTLVSAPARVKVGEEFTVTLKGVGWTELDNTVAVTYNNAYIGYACGFNSQGDVTLHLQAVGQPGTHLIDIYPTTFQGKTGQMRWGYQMPQLNALSDHPSLGAGYALPVYRIAVEVVDDA